MFDFAPISPQIHLQPKRSFLLLIFVQCFNFFIRSAVCFISECSEIILDTDTKRPPSIPFQLIYDKEKCCYHEHHYVMTIPYEEIETFKTSYWTSFEIVCVSISLKNDKKCALVSENSHWLCICLCVVVVVVFFGLNFFSICYCYSGCVKCNALLKGSFSNRSDKWNLNFNVLFD